MIENKKIENKPTQELTNNQPTQETFLQYAQRKQQEKLSENTDFQTQTADTFCKTLANTLEQNGKLTLTQLITKTGYARQTVSNHIKHLLTYGIIQKQTIPNSRGRPTIIYQRTTTPISDINKTKAVIISFNRLKQICLYEKHGHCNQRKEAKCNYETCPIVANRIPK
jgi:predicted transcriptional regulator